MAEIVRITCVRCVDGMHACERVGLSVCVCVRVCVFANMFSFVSFLSACKFRKIAPDGYVKKVDAAPPRWSAKSDWYAKRGSPQDETK